MSGISFSLEPADKPRRRGRPLKSVKPNSQRVREVKPVQSRMNGSINGRDDLGSWLWGAADILRGAVSPDKYVDYVLPLLFYKRLSDAYQTEYGETLAKFSDEKIARDKMFHRANIPEACLWDDVRKTSLNVGAKLNTALADIAKANPTLDRVINRTDFNNPNAIPEDRLVRLIEHFSGRNLANGNVTPDILGDGYEYLLKMFNEVAPTRAGEFYTPREVVKVLVGCLKPEEGYEVYDPCCGSGGMLIESYYYLKHLGKDPKKLFLYGQEINDDTWAISKMNVFLHDMEAQILQGDTFANPKFLEAGGLKQFDLVIANPMWNQDGFKQLMEDDRYGRFRYGVATNSSADWGWIQHMLASLKPIGRVGVVLDQGALFRGGAEGSIREGVLKDDLVECVVALPEKLFYNTSAPGCLIILNKKKPKERNKKVLFIYAFESYEKVTTMNKLRDDDATHIIKIFNEYIEEDKFSKIVDTEEIMENNCNLNVTRYLDIFDEPDSIDIKQVLKQLAILEKERHIIEEKLKKYLEELGYELY